MRNINAVIIHHSFTPKTLDLNKAVKSFSENHRVRLHQPQSKTGSYCAYHYVIGANGRIIQTRLDDEIGYHASSWPVNERSIGICLLGNFDAEKPNPEQLWALRDKIKAIKQSHFITEVSGHRKYSAKDCPGRNFTDKMIAEAFHPTV